MNSTSGVDPHITPEDAFSQVPRISRATGLEVNTLKTIIQNGVSKNLPRIYREHSGEIVILAAFILCLLVSAGALTYSLVRAER